MSKKTAAKNLTLGKKYPTKQTINLARHIRKPRKVGTTLLAMLLLCAVVAAFAKFAVYDRLAEANAAEAAAAAAQTQLADLRAANADYEQVRTEYEQYRLSQSTLSGAAVDPMDSLALVETYLLKASAVESFSVYSDMIAIKISDVTLNEVSVIYRKLLSDPLSVDVQVYTARADSSEKATTTFTVFLNVPDTGVAEIETETTTDGGAAQ